MSLNTWTDLNCPDCTETLNLGALPADQSCNSIPKLSQVCDLYITPNGAAQPFDWTGAPTIALVAGEIDNTNVDNTKTKWIVGRGGVSEPEEIETQGFKGFSTISKRRYTLTMEVSILEQEHYDFVRQLQCGWSDFTFNYGNRGKHLFGDTNGITPVKVNGQLPLQDGEDDTEIGRIIIEFETDNGDPRRGDNPHS